MAGEYFDKIYTNEESPEAKDRLLEDIAEQSLDAPEERNKKWAELYAEDIAHREESVSKTRAMLENLAGMETKDQDLIENIRFFESTIEIDLVGIDTYREKLSKVKELEKTEAEKTAIDESIRTVNDVLRGLGLPEEVIPLENIHIYSGEAFQEMARPGAGAFYDRRHIYIPRQEKTSLTMSFLTHEMMHLVSFSLGARFGNTDILYERQSGFDFGASKKRSKFLFRGFNEAIIESMSLEARERVDTGKLNMSEKEAGEMMRVSYFWHVRLFRSIVYRYMRVANPNFAKLLDEFVEAREKFQKDGVDPEGFRKKKVEFEFLEGQLIKETKDKIFSACIKGDYSIFKELEVIQPRGDGKRGFTEIIANMGEKFEDVKQVAEELDFSYISEQIPVENPAGQIAK